MNCEWIPLEDRWKCKYCGFVVSNNTYRKNCLAKKEIPGLVQRAKNLGKATINHIKTGMKHCSEEQKQERFNICKSNKCGLFRVYGDGGICAHSDCGCCIRSNGKFLDKLSWADSKCPVGMWEPISTVGMWGPIEKTPENDENDV